MEIREEHQANPVEDPVGAYVAVARPILAAVLQSIGGPGWRRRRALRIAIGPPQSGHSDAIARDDKKNLVICPIPHDASFMQTFHEGWRIVQALCETDFEMPKDVDIPIPLHREAARVFAERREFPIEDVIAATEKFAQPHLLDAKTERVATESFQNAAEPGTQMVLGPFPRIDSD